MKKLLFALIIAVFFFGCKSDENDDDIPGDTTEITPVETVVAEDTVEVVLTEEEFVVKSDEVLQKSEEIVKEIDEVLNNL